MGKEKPTFFVNMRGLGELQLKFEGKWCNKLIFVVESFFVMKNEFFLAVSLWFNPCT